MIQYLGYRLLHRCRREVCQKWILFLHLYFLFWQVLFATISVNGWTGSNAGSQPMGVSLPIAKNRNKKSRSCRSGVFVLSYQKWIRFLHLLPTGIIAYVFFFFNMQFFLVSFAEANAPVPLFPIVTESLPAAVQGISFLGSVRFYLLSCCYLILFLHGSVHRYIYDIGYIFICQYLYLISFLKLILQ